MDEDWPLIAYLSKAKAIKPSNEIQNHKSKKAFKFNFVLTSQNTNLWKTSFGKNSIPKVGTNYELPMPINNQKVCSTSKFYL